MHHLKFPMIFMPAGMPKIRVQQQKLPGMKNLPHIKQLTLNWPQNMSAALQVNYLLTGLKNQPPISHNVMKRQNPKQPVRHHWLLSRLMPLHYPKFLAVQQILAVPI